MAQQAQLIFLSPWLTVVTITIAMAITATVISTVVAVAMSVAMSVAVVSVVRVGLSLSISCRFGFPLAETGDSSIGVSGQTGGVVVACESRVHIVVVAQNKTVAVGLSVGTPLAVNEVMTKAEALGRPVSV